MKTINLLGVDYTEDKIQVLINYVNYMEKTMGPISRIDSLVEYMIKSQKVSDEYLAAQSEEDREVLKHFADARIQFIKEHPAAKLTVNSILVFSYGLISALVPPVVNLGICAVLAKFITNNIREMADKKAYMKIEQIVRQELKED